MQINQIQLKQLVEASLFVAKKPMSVKALMESVLSDVSVSRDRINRALTELMQEYQERGVQLVKVAGGYRFQTLETLSPFLQKLWQEKAPKYSRATLETLAVIAYRQPATRGDIESVRGVAVSSQIIKTLSDRSWIKVVGHKEVPGRPALYATTIEFLAYFGLETLADLPPLSDAESLQALFGETETAESASDTTKMPETKEESTNE